VLDECSPQPSNGGAFTSIGVWRGPYASLEHGGRTYGLRVHEFRKFAALPRLSAARFDAALAIHPADTADLELLSANGWRLIDPRAVNGDVGVSTSSVTRSPVLVAKGICVDTRSGWFSDRSICFLASGRPCSPRTRDRRPPDSGLLTFTTMEEAVGASSASPATTPPTRTRRGGSRSSIDLSRVLGEA
jgi:hypothetical protein